MSADTLPGQAAPGPDGFWSFQTRREATDERFDEAGYLAANPDVAGAVASGAVASGWTHFEQFGRLEKRAMVQFDVLKVAQQQKLRRIRPLLDLALPHVRRNGKYDFLTPELRAAGGLSDITAAADNPFSENPYEVAVVDLIQRHPDGVILDCGAGDRPICYSNVVTMEIVDYPTTDLIGSGEQIPFKDGSLDGVISMAVLEHVRDPFRCAAEISRVLRPGGEVVCCVPFLQPEHGFPHHYFNMAPQGLRALFDRHLTIDAHDVVESTLPLWSLTWFLRAWSDGLTGAARDEFLAMRIGDLVVDPRSLLAAPWVRQLPTAKNFELASATTILAHKPA